MNVRCVFYLLLLGLSCHFCQPFDCRGQDSERSQSSNEKRTEHSITPTSMGFTPRTVSGDDGDVHYYVSTAGRPLNEEVTRPLVLYLDGSGPSPIFSGTRRRLGSTLMFMPNDFPDYHYVVISKPGVRFHESERRIKSPEYDRTLSLPWRVNAANAVINDLVTEEFVDSSCVLVLGHSEGADVAPWVAAGNGDVTHVAGLAPGGVSQMFDFILFVRKQVESGKLTKAEGDERIRDIKNKYRDIFANPAATDKSWQGETYLRWSTFFRPAMEAWCQIEVPVYLGSCRDDKNTPVECGEAIELEFIRRGKENLTSRVWPTDHSFGEWSDDNESGPVDRRMDVLGEILEWVKRTK